MDIEHNPIIGEGSASCDGGGHPDFPLLVWQHGEFHLEDGTASVSQIAGLVTVTPDIHTIAAQLGTTPEHVAQALAYAANVGKQG
jgi:hypothetical protein